jgi:hypothetical protein
MQGFWPALIAKEVIIERANREIPRSTRDDKENGKAESKIDSAFQSITPQMPFRRISRPFR